MSTQSQYLVTVTVDGRPIGVFDTRSGGEVEADVQKRKVGGGRTQTYPSFATPADLTVSRGYERERDHDLSKWLERRCGLGQMVVTEQPLGTDGAAWGTPKIFTGVLKTVNTGEVDSDSNDPRMLELGMVTADAT